MTLIEEWREAFRYLERPCPWPGPRPLDPAKEADAPWRFVGRPGEVGKFIRAVSGHALVVFHGESGAGKSSLLNVALVPALRRRRFRPFVVRAWAGSEGDDAETIVTNQLRRAMPDRLSQLMADGLGFIEALDVAYEGRAVLILDQFEELTRLPGTTFEKVLQWLLDVNASHRTRVVLSLRSEHMYQLDDFLKQVRPFSVTQLRLPPMTDPVEIRAVIDSANSSGAQVISPSAVDWMLAAWTRLPLKSPQRSLLYLHATLYALFWRTHARGPGPIEVADIDGFVREASPGELNDHDLAPQFFAAGFDATIDKKLELCASACRIATEGEVGDAAGLRVLARAPLVSAVQEQIRQSVEHLSSGGYKLQQELPGLLLLTTERQLELLAATEERPQASFTPAEVQRMAAAITGMPVDLLAASREEIVAAAGIGLPRGSEPDSRDAALASLGVSPPPWRVDEFDVTAGVLLGRAPWEALVEEVRAFAFAIEWLEEAAIVRVSSPFGTAMATLVHDGFGPALKKWAGRDRSAPDQAVLSLSAFHGERWTWGAAGALDGGSAWRTLVNLRWRRCEITATTFRRVVFVNCDFRATRFEQCVFEGATFVNCLLDGASFEACTIRGESTPHSMKEPPYYGSDRLPEFELALDADLAGDFHFYRGTDKGATWLYSPTSGVAAIPREASAKAGGPGGTTAAMLVEPCAGGLTMAGGRLSSLMVSGCTMGDGSITFEHIAGSSLDLVEQEEVRLTLSWCTVLGLTVSSKVHSSGGVVDITAAKCVLANTWFGPDLQGTVEVTDCLVYAMTNLSPDAKVRLTNSAHGATLNVRAENSAQLGEATEQARSKTLADFTDSWMRMAYRSRPAEVELLKRAAEVVEGAGAPD